MEAPELNVLADELLERAVLYFDQEAIVFIETDEGDLLVNEPYQDLRNNIYDILDNAINEETR